MRAWRGSLWTLSLAAAAGLAAWVWSRYSGGLGTFIGVASRIGPRAWAAALAASAAFYFLDYLRFHALLRLFGIRLGLAGGLKLTAVSYFVSSLTPVAELHLPAVVYWMSQEAIPAPVGAAVTVAKSLYMTLWIMAVAALSARLEGGLPLPPAVEAGLPVTANLLLFSALALGAVAAFPGAVESRSRAWAARPGRAAWAQAAALAVGRFAGAVASIGRSTHPWHLACHAASVAFILAYAAAGSALATGAGHPLEPRRALAVFSNSLLVAYLAPVPGSIGVTELATAWLMDPSIPPQAMAVAWLLRSLCWYAVLPAGAFLILAEARRAGAAALWGRLLGGGLDPRDGAGDRAEARPGQDRAA